MAGQPNWGLLRTNVFAANNRPPSTMVVEGGPVVVRYRSV